MRLALIKTNVRVGFAGEFCISIVTENAKCREIYGAQHQNYNQEFTFHYERQAVPASHSNNRHAILNSAGCRLHSSAISSWLDARYTTGVF